MVTFGDIKPKDENSYPLNFLKHDKNIVYFITTTGTQNVPSIKICPKYNSNIESIQA